MRRTPRVFNKDTIHERRRISPSGRAILTVALISLTFLIGSTGYMLIEEWSIMDSLYMTVITLSTVGFQEVKPLSPDGRAFTAFMILLGIGSFGYGFGSLVAFFVEGELTDLIRARKMEKLMKSMRDHIVICGHGSEGRHAAEELRLSGTPMIIVEKNPELAEKLQEAGQLVICGDATQDDVLLKAGVQSARGLIAAVHEDTQNVFVTLTARGFNTDLVIVSKASDEASVSKLLRAGANKVISSAEIGGKRMASALTRPGVVNFLDVITNDRDLSLRLEEVPILEESGFDGKSISDLQIGARTGALVIGLHRKGQEVLVNPGADSILQCGDTLIVLGNDQQLGNLRLILTTQ